jgi:hypothetical protein
MRLLQRCLSVALVSWVFSLVVCPLAYAHLMVAQHGTLNIVEDGAFMVLSLPISAFRRIDDDHDGKVTMIEFNNHRSAIVTSVKDKVILSDTEGRLSLQGIMLSPVSQHDTNVESISHLAIMGRFTLSDAAKALRFEIGLYGPDAVEKSLEITATRPHDRQKVTFQLTPAEPASLLFPDSV